MASMFSLVLEWRLWALIVVLAGVTMTASVAKYRLGQSGFESLKEHFPQVEDEKWETVHRHFIRWGLLSS